MLHDNGTPDNLQTHSGCPSRHTRTAAEYQSPRGPVRTPRGEATQPDSGPFGALWLLAGILTIGFAGEWNYHAARDLLVEKRTRAEVRECTHKSVCKGPEQDWRGLFGDGAAIREAWRRDLRR